ncbi:MAG: hypothetical protein KJ792_06990 [Actinobacteria bacterium]|nr:hypothetical protein [Actinomycetota bacterium]MCG2803128.1 hypothetical protein [Cellulomonas sp.]
MLDLFLDLVFLVFHLHERSPRTLRRALAKADAAGGSLVFDGAVRGPAEYCHEDPGVLEIDGGALTWRPGAEDEDVTTVPVDRLFARELTVRRRRAQVACTDGPAHITLTCPRYAVGYLARVVPGLGALLDVHGERLKLR